MWRWLRGFLIAGIIPVGMLLLGATDAILAVSEGGTGNSTGDISQLVATATGGSTTRTMGDWVASVLGQVSVEGTLLDGDLVCGGTDTNKVQDCGVVALKPYSSTIDPTATNDNTQGYHQNSFGFNTLTGDVFVCQSAATNAAIWVKLASSLASPQPIGWNFTQNTGNGAVIYTSPGGTGPIAGGNINYIAIISVAGRLSRLNVHTAAAPGFVGGVHLHYYANIFVGLPLHLTQATLHCTITDPNQDCDTPDVTDVDDINQWAAYSLQLSSDAGANATGQSSAALLYTPGQ